MRGASLQHLLPGLRDQLVGRAAAHQMGETWEVQMHAGDREPFGHYHVEHLAARRRGGIGVGIELHAHLWPCGLHLRDMHRVTPDQELILARADQERGVARRMAGAWDGGDTGEYFAILEEAPAVLVGQNLLAP